MSPLANHQRNRAYAIQCLALARTTRCPMLRTFARDAARDARWWLTQIDNHERRAA